MEVFTHTLSNVLGFTILARLPPLVRSPLVSSLLYLISTPYFCRDFNLLMFRQPILDSGPPASITTCLCDYLELAMRVSLGRLLPCDRTRWEGLVQESLVPALIFGVGSFLAIPDGSTPPSKACLRRSVALHTQLGTFPVIPCNSPPIDSAFAQPHHCQSSLFLL